MTRSLAALTELAARVLERAGTSAANARAVAAALVAADADGIASHGLSRLPSYADQVRAGKVDGRAVPVVTRPRAAAVRVDAADGFAFPALDAGLAAAGPVLAEAGTVAVAIANSHHFGVAGHAVERLARQGAVALAFSNSPAAIAPWGGRRPLFGTNPIAFACPTAAHPTAGEPLVIDLSLSVVARGRIAVAAARGEAIPEGWAVDAEGRPTTDARAALGGAMLPMGGPKGGALALMVELLCAALTGSNTGFEASSFLDAEGPPPRIGQLLIGFDPAAFGDRFPERVATILGAMAAEPGVRLPGARRLAARVGAAAEGLALPPALLEEMERRASQ